MPLLVPEGNLLFERLLKLLLASSFLEVLLNRILSRAGRHIPKEGPAATAFDVLTDIGPYIFTLSLLIAVLLLSWVFYENTKRSGSTQVRVLCGLYFFFLGVCLLGSFASKGMGLSLVYNLSSLALIMVLCCYYFLCVERVAEKAFAVLLGVSYLCYYYFKTSHLFYQVLSINSLPPLTVQAFSLGEFIAILNGFVAFAAFYGLEGLRELAHPQKRYTAFPLVIAFLFIFFYVKSRFMVSMLATYSLGFTLYLPFPLYAASLAAYLFTLNRCLYRRVHLGYALFLVAVAGYTVELTYQVFLALLALVLLLGERKGRPLKQDISS